MSGFSQKNKTNLTDEELVERIRLSNDTAFEQLYDRYLPKMRTMTYSFQGLGYDLEDLLQEATIGFYTAINVYDFKSSSFSTFCYTCMRRMLVALLRKTNRKKSVPEDSVIYTDASFFDLPSPNNPESDYIAKEDFLRFKSRILTELSYTEREVLYNYISGLNYNEIAIKLGLDKKSVDNALQRIRRKLR